MNQQHALTGFTGPPGNLVDTHPHVITSDLDSGATHSGGDGGTIAKCAIGATGVSHVVLGG